MITLPTAIVPTAAITPLAENFGVVDAKSANWVVRHILEARAYAAQVEEWAQSERQRAEEAEKFFLSRYGEQLEAFAHQSIAEQNQRFRQHPRKSVKLPGGTLGFRAQPVRVRIMDEDALLEWCKIHLPDAVQRQVIERVSRTVINEHYDATGELPEGTAIEAEQDRFFIK